MNTILEKKKRQILLFFKTIPIVTTEQVALFFQEASQPTKRASACLVALQEEGIIEGRRRKGKSKCWRLSKKGRILFETDTRPVPFTTRNLQHVLSIGDVYVHLFLTGKLRFFEHEKKIDFISQKGDILRYSPDAFFFYNEHYYFLEVQRTVIDQERWQLKWEIVSQFFSSAYVRKKEHFSFFNTIEKLSILVISGQPESEIISHDDSLSLTICPSIESFLALSSY